MISIQKRFGVEPGLEQKSLGADDDGPAREISTCPITLEPIQRALVLDGHHVFDAHALLQHFVRQALTRGIASRSWTNPMTNTSVKSAWVPPDPAQAWIEQASSAGSKSQIDFRGRLGRHRKLGRVDMRYGLKGKLSDALNPSESVSVRPTADALPTVHVGLSTRVTASWAVDITLLLRVWSHAAQSCTATRRSGSGPMGERREYDDYQLERVWGALGRYALTRELVAGVPLYYEGPGPLGTRPVLGELLMADGTRYVGTFSQGALQGTGTVTGPSNEVVWLHSTSFVGGSVCGQFRLKFVNGEAGKEGMRFRAVGVHVPPREGSPRRMGAFRIYCRHNAAGGEDGGGEDNDEADDEKQDWANAGLPRADAKSLPAGDGVCARWWGERASFEVRFEPRGAASLDSAGVPIPSRSPELPTAGSLTVCETVFDSVLMRPRRFVWSGPAHLSARADDRHLGLGGGGLFSGRDSFSSSAGGGPGPRIVPRITPADHVRWPEPLLLDRLVVDPPYAPERQTPSTTEMLQRRVRDMLVGSTRVVRTFFTACEATLWSTARVVFDPE